MTLTERNIERLNELVFSCRFYANDGYCPYKDRSYKSKFWSVEQKWAEKLSESFTNRDKLIDEAFKNSVFKVDTIASWKSYAHKENIPISLLACLALEYSSKKGHNSADKNEFTKWLKPYTSQPVNNFEDYKYFKGEIEKRQKTSWSNDIESIPYENFLYHEKLIFEHRRRNPRLVKNFENHTKSRIEELKENGIKDAFTDPDIKIEHKVNALFMEEMHWHWSSFNTFPMMCKYFYEKDWRQNYANKCLFYRIGESNPFGTDIILYDYWERERKYVEERPKIDFTYSDIGKRFPDVLRRYYNFVFWDLKLYLFHLYCDIEEHKTEEFVVWFRWYIRNWRDYKKGKLQPALYKDFSVCSCPRCNSTLNEIDQKGNLDFMQCPVCGQRVKFVEYIPIIEGCFIVKDYVNKTYNIETFPCPEYIGLWKDCMVYKYDRKNIKDEFAGLPLVYIIDEDGKVGPVPDYVNIRTVCNLAKRQNERMIAERIPLNIKECRYYNGEETNPFEFANDISYYFWDMECFWVRERSKDPCAFSGYTTELESDFPIEVLRSLKTPLSLIAIFYNRYYHWNGDSSGFIEYMKGYIEGAKKTNVNK